MQIIVENEQDEIALDLSSFSPIIEFVLAQEGRHTDELSLFFVSEERICQLHEQFFSDPSPTDCISFPMENEAGASYHVLGDIFVSPKAAMEFVKEHPEQDFSSEVALYVIHGLLHLLGYRDDSETLREHMHAKQNQYLIDLLSL